jgi:hypothetical protein
VVAGTESVIRVSEVTVKARHPTSPDLCFSVSRGPGGEIPSPSYRMRALREPIQHRQEVDGSKHPHYIRAPLPCGVPSSSPDCTEDTHSGPGDEILQVASDSVSLSVSGT